MFPEYASRRRCSGHICFTVLAGFSRLSLIAWVSIWVTSLPLFHTHLPGVFQQPIGIPHTVFSPDLPGELQAFRHKTATDEFELSILASYSEELEFVASLEEDGKRKPLSACAPFRIVSLWPPQRIGRPLGKYLPLINQYTSWCVYSLGSRAPPTDFPTADV